MRSESKAVNWSSILIFGSKNKDVNIPLETMKIMPTDKFICLIFSKN